LLNLEFRDKSIFKLLRFKEDMSKTIQIEVPENLELEDYIKLEKEIKEKVKKYILLAELNNIVDKLNLTDRDFEKFKETQRNVWAKYERFYREKGVLK